MYKVEVRLSRNMRHVEWDSAHKKMLRLMISEAINEHKWWEGYYEFDMIIEGKENKWWIVTFTYIE